MTSADELFGAGATQAQMLAQLLDAFPGQRDGVLVPIHPKARLPWAEALIARGVRVHPELMEQFPIPGERPEAGFLNPHKWVGPEEYEQYAQSRPDPEQANNHLQQLLHAIDPSALNRIQSMTETERHEAFVQQSGQLPGLLEKITEYRKAWEGNQ